MGCEAARIAGEHRVSARAVALERPRVSNDNVPVLRRQNAGMSASPPSVPRAAHRADASVDHRDRTQDGNHGVATSATPSEATVSQAPRKRAAPGERRQLILQALAAMLESPQSERITTAALAARLQVSEAALYRHFASKAQMFDALLDFIEQALFERSAQIVAAVDAQGEPVAGQQRAARIVQLLLQFGERNAGLARVLCGDALLLEHERLQERANQVFERMESQLRQCLREAAQLAGDAAPTAQAAAAASVLVAFCQGRLQRFARSQFRRLPTEQLDACLARML